MRTTATVIEKYLGNGSLADYSYPFKCVNTAQIRVVISDDDNELIHSGFGVDGVFVINITKGPKNVGGTIHLGAPLANDYNLAIYFTDDLPTQEVPLGNSGKWTLGGLEEMFDKLTGQTARLFSFLKNQVPSVSEDYLGDFHNTPFEPTKKGVLGFNNDGDDFKTYEFGEFIGPAGRIENAQLDTEIEYTDPNPMAVTNVGTAEHADLRFTLRKGRAATINVGTITTVDPDDPADVRNVGDTSDAIFDFDLPKGEKGESTVLVTAEPLAPDDNIGSDGDIWIDTGFSPATKGDLYQRISGVYTLKTNIMGPAGGVNSIDTEQGDLLYAFSGYSARFSEAFNGTSLRDTISKILKFSYLPPQVSLTSNVGVGPYEKGFAITAINFTASVTKRSEDIEEVVFRQGGTILDTQTSGGAIPNGGNSTYSWSGSIVDTTSFQADVTDDSLGGGPTTVTGTRTFNYVFAYFRGPGAPGLAGAGVAGLTKEIISSTADKTVTYVMTIGDVPYFAYPTSYGALTVINDSNGFDVTGSFTRTTKSITNTHGETTNYYVYEHNNPWGINETTTFRFRR